MGFRRSLVRIQSARHGKARQDFKFWGAVFFLWETAFQETYIFRLILSLPDTTSPRNKKGELLGPDHSFARILIPYQPPQEYDLRIDFTPDVG